MTSIQTMPCGCPEGGLERTRFFPRQLVTPEDLTQDQHYFREKIRRHNRMLHGWGVVCGARVAMGDSACEVIVEPGYILGPYGDEITIDRKVTVDVCHEDLDGNATSPCGPPSDPWCSDIAVERPAGTTLFLAVRYAECQSRPVRGGGCGCGCDETECEYSRIGESFVIRVLRKLPSSYPAVMTPPDFKTLFARPKGGRPCPPCPTDPWVILADITMGARETIGTIDCFAHRRYVLSAAEFYMLGTP